MIVCIFERVQRRWAHNDGVAPGCCKVLVTDVSSPEDKDQVERLAAAGDPIVFDGDQVVQPWAALSFFKKDSADIHLNVLKDTHTIIPVTARA